MKNILLTFCLFFLSFSLWSQKASQQDLQGNWKLISYMVPGASLDVASGKVTLSEPSNAMAAAMADGLKADMESYAEGLRLATLEIKGDNFYRVIFDVVNNGPFTLGDRTDHQIMTVNFDNGTKEDVPFRMIDGKLYIANPGNTRMYIYQKL